MRLFKLIISATVTLLVFVALCVGFALGGWKAYLNMPREDAVMCLYIVISVLALAGGVPFLYWCLAYFLTTGLDDISDWKRNRRELACQRKLKMK